MRLACSNFMKLRRTAEHTTPRTGGCLPPPEITAPRGGSQSTLGGRFFRRLAITPGGTHRFHAWRKNGGGRRAESKFRDALLPSFPRLGFLCNTEQNNARTLYEKNIPDSLGWRRFSSLPTFGSSDRTGAARLAVFLPPIRRRACILSRTAISFRTGNICSLESRTLTGSYCTCYFVGRQPHIVRNKHRTFKMVSSLRFYSA